ncbi:MAG: hypothetical protein ACFFCW_04180 [Candidatus Hodarchaeota archaeon]
MSQRLTVNQSFKKLISNLEPTKKQRQRIRTSRETIESVLANDDRITLITQQQPSFLTGSYARNTLIRPIDDIDLYVRIHYRMHAEGKSPLSILRLMASSIRNRYNRNTGVDVDSPCVVVRFLDYKFEVAPVFGYSDDLELYGIPAPGSRTWMQCYPNVPSRWLSSCNHLNNGMFIPMIKILKQWNRAHRIGLKSFHLELLTERVFSAITEIRSYPQGVIDWMYCVRRWISENDYPFIPEPGHTYKYVDEYLYRNRLLLLQMRRRLERNLRKAERAWDFYTRGREAAAKRIYRDLFGSMFPAPEPSPAKTVLIPPKTDPAPTLKDLALSQQPLGILPGLHVSELAKVLANPAPTPPRNAITAGIMRNLLSNAFSDPPKPQNELQNEFGRNVLLELLLKTDNPFRK